jgi:hypothetical protein
VVLRASRDLSKDSKRGSFRSVAKRVAREVCDAFVAAGDGELQPLDRFGWICLQYLEEATAEEAPKEGGLQFGGSKPV